MLVSSRSARASTGLVLADTYLLAKFTLSPVRRGAEVPQHKLGHERERTEIGTAKGTCADTGDHV